MNWRPELTEEQQRKRRDAQHIHACAMIVIHMEEKHAQGVIMDYIIKHERDVPIFMLNKVPWYVEGYLAALESENNDA